MVMALMLPWVVAGAVSLPGDMADPEDEGKTGERQDGRNLIQEWLDNNLPGLRLEPGTIQRC
ncbi:MAG: hypothetical protein R3F53_10485 [Gammaproteobacteria bacterium]